MTSLQQQIILAQERVLLWDRAIAAVGAAIDGQAALSTMRRTAEELRARRDTLMGSVQSQGPVDAHGQ